MKVALFGRVFSDDKISYLQLLVNKLELEHIEIVVAEDFYHYVAGKVDFRTMPGLFTKESFRSVSANYLVSVGGDGTMLDAITYVGRTGVPVMGINLGRLGFLSSIHKEDIEQAIDDLLSGQFRIDKRSLLRLETEDGIFGDFNYALNELTVNKKDTGSMILVNVFVNDIPLNGYWGDGLIIATPTGSTAYSLSCNGPILSPDSENFIITPIATHNLTVRPVVIPDKSEITLKVDGRFSQYLVGLDNRYETIGASTKMLVRKETFQVNIVQRLNDNFFSTLRQKLMWGHDMRI